METWLGIVMGIGLASACGFRVFVPMLGTSLAAYSGHLELSSGFEWIGSPVAAICFGTATLLEIAGFYVPWLDNLLDTAATPAAAIAGTILTASMVADISPFLQWTLAIIAGGGIAGTIQGGTALLRGASTGTTAGTGNPILSTIELVGSILMTILSFVLPILAAVIGIALLAMGILLFRRLLRWFRSRQTQSTMPLSPVA